MLSRLTRIHRTVSLVAATCAMLMLSGLAQAQSDDGTSQKRPGFESPKYIVTVTVFEVWPAHPKLNFNISQRETNTDLRKPRRPSDHRMGQREYKNWLASGNDENLKIVTSPRVTVEPRQPASLRVGANDADGNPISGFRFSVTLKQSKRHLVALQFSYDEYGLDVRAPASDYENGDQVHVPDSHAIVPAGTTQFALATGYIGAPMRLVAVTVDPIEVVTGKPARDVFPKIEYYTSVWEFGDVEPDLTDVIDEKHMVQPLRIGDRHDPRAIPVFWVLPEGDADRRLLQWLREHGRGTSIGGKAGAAVGDPKHWTTLEAPKGWYNLTDVPRYNIRFNSMIAQGGQADEDAVRVRVEVENVDEAGDVIADQVWRRHEVRFTAGLLGVAVIPATDRSPWRVLLMRAKRIDSWDEIPKQTFTTDGPEEIEIRLPDAPPPVKPPKKKQQGDG